jgi:transcriptional regulator with XRE-family HTH domain
VDTEQLAREFLVALRGKRSQVAWSRRLGYRSNVAYTWEAGRRFPTIAETFRAVQRSGLDLRACLESFHGHETRQWLDEHEDLATVEATAAFMRDIKGRSSTTEVAKRADLSRYSVTRWLAGQTQPRLPDFFTLLDAASLRLVDFVTSFVPPESVPCALPTWKRLEARRQGAGRYPWTQAILRALEVADYLALPEHEPGWIAQRLSIPLEEEEACLEYLELTGQVERVDGRFRPATSAVDTRLQPSVGRQLKSHWANVGVERIDGGAPGQYSYNVFTCSAEDFERIRELHLAYYRALRQIVAASHPEEHVVVANIQLFKLDPAEGDR